MQTRAFGGRWLCMLFRRASILLAILPVHLTAADLSFNRDIRPILSDNCFYCHGPDKNNRKGDLRLDVREELIKLGPQTLIERITTTDADDLMPPAESHKKLLGEAKGHAEAMDRRRGEV